MNVDINYNKIKRTINRLRKAMHFPSVAVNIIHNDVATSFVLGKSNIKAKQLATNDTWYYLSSCSKAFTSMLCVIAYSEHKIDLYKPIKQQLAGNYFYDEYTDNNITLAQMLSHLSGLPRHELMQESCSTRQQLAEKVAYLLPTSELGDKFQYQNQVYVLIGHILERIYNKSWEELIVEKIAIPLGMNIKFTGLGDFQDNLATPYVQTIFSSNVVPANCVSIDNPCGGIILTNTDTQKWLDCLVSNGKGLVPKEYFDLLLVPTPLNDTSDSQPNSYALGWDTSMNNGYKVVSHGGVNIGFQSEIAFIPQLNLGFSILTNCLGLPLQGMIKEIILDEVFSTKKRCYIWHNIKKYLLTKHQGNGEQAPAFATDELVEGNYHDQGYGDIAIEQADDKLFMAYYGEKVPLTRQENVYTFPAKLGMRGYIEYSNNTDLLTVYIYAGVYAKAVFQRR